MEKNLKINFDLPGLGVILTIIGTILKLCGVMPIAAWSWWIICLPVIIAVTFTLIVLLFVGIVLLFCSQY